MERRGRDSRTAARYTAAPATVHDGDSGERRRAQRPSQQGGDWMKREGNLTPFLVVTAEEKRSSGVPPSTAAQCGLSEAMNGADGGHLGRS
ncbi:alkaline phosphatase [Sesbania bispinosa]|nr:alkaline phosphatase [Sesbania bispinosa]